MIAFEDIASIFEQTLRVKPGQLTLETRRGDLREWDSLGHIMLVEALGNKLGVQISADEALNMESVADILRIIQAKKSPAK